jgi:phosphinothricin acetyltransferase
VLNSSGFKFGRWLDVVFMQRALGDGERTLPPR